MSGSNYQIIKSENSDEFLIKNGNQLCLIQHWSDSNNNESLFTTQGNTTVKGQLVELGENTEYVLMDEKLQVYLIYYDESNGNLEIKSFSFFDMMHEQGRLSAVETYNLVVI